MRGRRRGKIQTSNQGMQEKKDGNAKMDKGSRKNMKVWHLEAFQLRAFRCFVLVAVT